MQRTLQIKGQEPEAAAVAATAAANGARANEFAEEPGESCRGCHMPSL